MKLISVIIPAYNEEENIPIIYHRLLGIASDGTFPFPMEFLFVDDGSTDHTVQILSELAASDSRVKVIRLSRNFGSHNACRAGLAHAKGEAAVVIAADLQDPPELIPRLTEKWENGSNVVWAMRDAREDSGKKIFFANLYYRLVNSIALANYPSTGADVFLIDRKVIDAVTTHPEKNSSLVGQIFWAGFQQTFVTYKKEKRHAGRSKWTLSKQIKLAIDTFVSFSFFPIRLISYSGIVLSLLGFAYAIFLIFNKLFLSNVIPGWSSLMIVILFVSGIQLIMLGIIGEYLWRALDAARPRPLFLVEKKIGFGEGVDEKRCPETNSHRDITSERNEGVRS